MEWNSELDTIRDSLTLLIPELLLSIAIILFLLLGLVHTKSKVLTVLALALFVVCAFFVLTTQLSNPTVLFNGLLRLEGVGGYMKLLIDMAAVLTCIMWRNRGETHASDFFALLTSAVLGAHLLASTTNALMVFLSLELLSISSYVLSGLEFSKRGSEASVKYFLFGAVSSAVMLYGFSFLFGITGGLDFSSEAFFKQILQHDSPLAATALFMVLAGFLFKISAAPMHIWAPDVYQGAPVPIVAFLSVAPKLAGLTVLTKFIVASRIFGQSSYDWQSIASIIAIFSIAVGNFSALRQSNPKRLMAYSSIAQSGFMLVGVAAFQMQGIHSLLFYAAVYLIMNFVVFYYIELFEKHGIDTIERYAGVSKRLLWPSIFLLLGLVSLTGLPPTAGFTAKLLIFSLLWQSYETTGKVVLIFLLIFGLLNTVVSLFYYLRIPYYAFLKNPEPTEKPNLIAAENLFGFILVVVLLVLFFSPGLLMSWINKINFVL